MSAPATPRFMYLHRGTSFDVGHTPESVSGRHKSYDLSLQKTWSAHQLIHAALRNNGASVTTAAVTYSDTPEEHLSWLRSQLNVSEIGVLPRNGSFQFATAAAGIRHFFRPELYDAVVLTRNDDIWYTHAMAHAVASLAERFTRVSLENTSAACVTASNREFCGFVNDVWLLIPGALVARVLAQFDKQPYWAHCVDKASPLCTIDVSLRFGVRTRNPYYELQGHMKVPFRGNRSQATCPRKYRKPKCLKARIKPKDFAGLDLKNSRYLHPASATMTRARNQTRAKGKSTT